MREGRTESLSLSELNGMVRDAIRGALPGHYWVAAEIGEIKENSFSRHCYLELVEKNAVTNQITAKSRAVIWANNYLLLKHFFESQTNTPLTTGIKVLVKASVDFHELYGFSLTISEIDPSYTLGEMHLRKMQVINQLEKEGILSMNKELPLPALLTRVAVISSPTAAGYGDFINHLNESPYGSRFAVKLFAAVMQGEKTEASIIAALDRIYQHIELFDAVVIIRGGGATSDLNAFDSYPLAANCAQFPLPILSGIGHERDESIVDMVAHTRLKTPTAVAGFLLNRFSDCVELLNEAVLGLSEIVENSIDTNNQTLQRLSERLLRAASGHIVNRRYSIARTAERLKNVTENSLRQASYQLTNFEQFFKMASPEYILKKGYALVVKEGRAVAGAAQLKANDGVELRFTDGTKKATIQ